MLDRSKLAYLVRASARSALIILLSTLILSLVSPVIDVLFGGRFKFDWVLSLKFCLVWGVLWFVVFFVWNFLSALRAQPVLDILEKEASESGIEGTPMFGFVAMEYYGLILNRTYMVFVSPEGLYVWRAQGPQTNSNPKYWEPYRNMLDDGELTRNRRAIQELSRRPGGFFLERSSIISVAADDRRKWGMGGIPHSGRVHLRLASGKSREFILLGSVIPEDIRDRIVSVLGVGVTSAV